MFPVEVKIFFNRVPMPKLFGREGNLAEAQDAYTKLLPPIYAYLEKTVPDTGFLVGGALSIADVAVTSVLVNLHYCGADGDAATHPRLAAYYSRIAARPSFASLIARDKAMLAA